MISNKQAPLDRDRELTRRIAWDYISSLLEKIKALEARVTKLEQLLTQKDGRRS